MIDTFKQLYAGALAFEGNEVVIFDLDDEVLINEARHCILLALTYYDRKHLPMLGETWGDVLLHRFLPCLIAE